MLVHNVLHGQIVTLLVAASFPTNSKCHHLFQSTKIKIKMKPVLMLRKEQHPHNQKQTFTFEASAQDYQDGEVDTCLTYLQSEF
jgi:hypothetical protein